jgi:hypothetical protein
VVVGADPFLLGLLEQHGGAEVEVELDAFEEVLGAFDLEEPLGGTVEEVFDFCA